MKKHKWKDGSRAPKGVSADTAANEFERIRKASGTLTPEAVVDASRPKKAPLHPAFEWDDALAAERYRRNQAATMIRAVVVVSEETEQEHRGYVLVSGESEKSDTHYMPTDVVVQNVDLFADALGRLEGKMRELSQSVQELERAAKMDNPEPERMARIALAIKSLEMTQAAFAALH